MSGAGIEFSVCPQHARGVIYVLAYPSLEAPQAKQIADFRARHEPLRARLVPPHITLVFGVSDRHLDAIAALMETASSQSRGIAVSFDAYAIAFDPFEEKYKAFLVCGKGRDDVTRLHHRLYNGAHRAELSTAHPFRPHMTVATNESRSEIEQVDMSSMGALPIKADLRALELVRLANGKLTTLLTTSLER